MQIYLACVCGFLGTLLLGPIGLLVGVFAGLFIAGHLPFNTVASREETERAEPIHSHRQDDKPKAPTKSYSDPVNVSENQQSDTKSFTAQRSNTAHVRKAQRSIARSRTIELYSLDAAIAAINGSSTRTVRTEFANKQRTDRNQGKRSLSNIEQEDFNYLAGSSFYALFDTEHEQPEFGSSDGQGTDIQSSNYISDGNPDISSFLSASYSSDLYRDSSQGYDTLFSIFSETAPASSYHDDFAINPANGNPMIGGMGGIDIEGNPYGADFYSNDDLSFPETEIFSDSNSGSDLFDNDSYSYDDFSSDMFVNESCDEFSSDFSSGGFEGDW